MNRVEACRLEWGEDKLMLICIISNLVAVINQLGRSKLIQTEQNSKGTICLHRIITPRA